MAGDGFRAASTSSPLQEHHGEVTGDALGGFNEGAPIVHALQVACDYPGVTIAAYLSEHLRTHHIHLVAQADNPAEAYSAPVPAAQSKTAA